MSASPEVIHGRGFDAEVIRTDRRKTATVKVERGRVAVVVPKATSTSRIESLIAEKTPWIKQKLLLHRQQIEVKPKEYVSGECFTYLGRNYRLKVIAGSRREVKLLNGRLVVSLPTGTRSPEAIRAALEQWYIEHAKQKLQEKVDRYAKRLELKPAKLNVRSFKSRWGSCSVKGDLTLNWRVIIAPQRIVDYVVVHELCHLRHHDHSPQFWSSVEHVLPDYRECREWLKAHAQELVI